MVIVRGWHPTRAGMHGMALAQFARKLSEWSAGLPEPTVVWSHDTGDGDSGLWIEGVREPNAADLKRLEDCRRQQLQNDRRELGYLQERIAVNQANVAVDPQVADTGTPSTRD